jgi:hypothetical protein
MGTVINLAEFSGNQDKSHSKEKDVLQENVLGQENLIRVENGVFTAELAADLKTLSATALRSKYKTEASVHRNRKHQCKGAFAPEFQDFRSFLAHVGICPHPGWSLDRIDNTNLDYGPGLVRWASPKTQTRNRSTTTMVMFDGKLTPLAEVAEITGQSLDMLAKRKQRGWSDHEVVFGKASTPAPARSAERQWRELLPERMWPQWEWFERHALVKGRDHLPACWQSASTEFIATFEAGPRGRALRMYCTAGRYLADLSEQLADAQACADQYGDEPDPALLKKFEFWTEAHDRAWFVLREGVR